MQRKPFATITQDGIVNSINYEAVVTLGIPADSLVGNSILSHLIEPHRLRFECELSAVLNETEQYGKAYCTVVGADGVGRKLSFAMTSNKDGTADLVILPYRSPNSYQGSFITSLFDSGRILPVAKHILSIIRKAATKEELLTDGLKILAEAVGADGGAILEWESIRENAPALTIGNFDNSHLAGVFRSAIMARLTRGDVVVKETSLDGSDSSACLLIMPLLTGPVPFGVVLLQIARDTELVPEEQQGLVVLGEIMGLGVKALTSAPKHRQVRSYYSNDNEASLALGRLSSGFTHEINNAATILRNNIEQVLRKGDMINATTETAVKDSLSALETMHDLTQALKVFGPEETTMFEQVNLLRILDIVSRSVRFYAKRGINISLEHPENDIPLVRARSHHLTRVFFLIFVELFDASQDAGIELGVQISFKVEAGIVSLSITVSAGPFSLPAVLLAQLEQGGTLAGQVIEAGGVLSHSVDHQGNMNITIALKESSGHSTPRMSSIAASPRRRGTILIADDEVAVIRSLRRVLDQFYDIFAARSGEEALEILKTNPHIEVVLYDVSMPRMGGIEFFEELQKQGLSQTHQIVFVKAGSYDPEVMDFLSSISNPVVDKPFDIPTLNDIIASMLI